MKWAPDLLVHYHEMVIWDINSLASGRCGCSFKCVIIKYIISMIDILCISSETDLRWMPQDHTDDKSTLVQVMAWCHGATGLCCDLSLHWPRLFRHMVSLVHNDLSHVRITIPTCNYCLETPIHYPNEWWLITKEVPWLRAFSWEYFKIPISKIKSKFTLQNLNLDLPGDTELTVQAIIVVHLADLYSLVSH